MSEERFPPIPPLLPPRPSTHRPQSYAGHRKSTDDGQDAWLITYADLITQLMCFFVIIVMISNPDPGKLGQVAKSLASGFVPNMVETPYAGFYKATETWIESQGVAADAAVSYTTRGVVVDLGADILFERGNAIPGPETKARLKALAEDLKKLPLERSRITVEGHTDDSPPAALYASSWELSAARAGTVARLLQEDGLPPDRIQTMAYGAFKPLVPNRDADTHAIEANQRKNRRVLIRVEKSLD